VELEADRVRLLPLKAHHTHNKPPNTMLAAITPILPTIQTMNNSYNIKFNPKKFYQTFQFSAVNQE
jgi:hypothetical protein